MRELNLLREFGITGQGDSPGVRRAKLGLLICMILFMVYGVSVIHLFVSSYRVNRQVETTRGQIKDEKKSLASTQETFNGVVTALGEQHEERKALARTRAALERFRADEREQDRDLLLGVLGASPAGIQLERLDRSDRTLELKGRSRIASTVSAFLEALSGLARVEEARIDTLEERKVDEETVYAFRFICSIQ